MRLKQPRHFGTIRKAIASLFFCFAFASACFSQVPEILKVEPPSWWLGSSVNPVRLMISGRNLTGARAQALGRGLRVGGAPRTNARGSYLFIDISITSNAQ